VTSPRQPASTAQTHPTDLVTRALAGERRALARVLTILETGGPDAGVALRTIYPHAGAAQVVGLTGPPGSGKSTLVVALARHYRAEGARVGVVAVDPTSPYTGGALLGDRVRMLDLTGVEGVFVRSVASRGSLGGLAAATLALTAALDAAGYSRILVETVGVGQAEVAVAQLAETTLVVSVPGLGDEVQALKAGLLEVADVLVVNKADRPDAERTLAELRGLQSLAPPAAWQPPVLATVATRGEGVAALAEAIAAHHHYLARTEDGHRRALARARAGVLAAAETQVLARLAVAAAAPAWQAAYEAVAAHARSPYDVAADLLAALNPDTVE
jgi:LAO/AO transport system kinase